MAGTVKLPIIGEVKSSWLVVGALATAAAVYVISRRSSSAAASTTSAADQAAASTAIDPQTGYPENSPEDIAALQALADGGAYTSAYGTAYGDGYGYGYAGIPGYPTTSTNPNSGPGTFTDNAYWIAYAEANIIGYSPTDIQAALTAALQGGTLTAAQYQIWQTALSVAGNPPNPPGVTPQPPATGQGPSGTGGGGGGQGPSGTGGGGVPPVIPDQGGGTNHHAVTGTVGGLSMVRATDTSVTLDWQAVAGATGYRVQVFDRGTTHVKESETVQGTTATVSGLAKGARYEFTVDALPGPAHSTIYASTTTSSPSSSSSVGTVPIGHQLV